jgi:hypothetical protein
MVDQELNCRLLFSDETKWSMKGILKGEGNWGWGATSGAGIEVFNTGSWPAQMLENSICQAGVFAWFPATQTGV